MDQALLKLVEDGQVDPEVALDRAVKKEPFEKLLARGKAGARMSSAPTGRTAGRRRRIDTLLRVVLEQEGVRPPPRRRLAADDPGRRRPRAPEVALPDRGRTSRTSSRPITPPKPLGRAGSATGDTDFAYAMGDLARFRVNVFRQEHGSGAVLRMIPPRVLDGRGARAPAARRGRRPAARAGSSSSRARPARASRRRSPRSSTGSTGRAPFHIITIEDPVEFVHTPKKSIITHRELGPDTPTFSGALKAALREDPDVVLVGELRDLETMTMALQAAETGLLVFGTLHTNSAAKAVDRLIDSFPAEEQEQVRTVLAEVLKGGRRAGPPASKKGGGRVAGVRGAPRLVRRSRTTSARGRPR